jgi:hypothetical protein
VADAIKPMLGAQAAWKKQILGIIASDAFKNTVEAQSNLGRIAEQLTKNLDLAACGVAGGRLRIYLDDRRAGVRLFKNLALAIAAMRANFYPPNLRAIEGLAAHHKPSWPFGYELERQQQAIAAARALEQHAARVDHVIVLGDFDATPTLRACDSGEDASPSTGSVCAIRTRGRQHGRSCWR